MERNSRMEGTVSTMPVRNYSLTPRQQLLRLCLDLLLDADGVGAQIDSGGGKVAVRFIS